MNKEQAIELIADIISAPDGPPYHRIIEALKAIADIPAEKDMTAVAEACAEAVDRMPLRHAGRADLTANQAVEIIRDGERKNIAVTLGAFTG
jgi:hypothetical protein